MDHDEDDEFFGEDEGSDCGLAEHEAHALDAHYQNVGYLEAYEHCKESRLQDGFEAGYRDTYEISFRLGQLLGQLTAKVTLISTMMKPANAPHGVEKDEAALKAKNISRRYRDVMDKINKLNDASSSDAINAVEMLLDLEKEAELALESITIMS